MQEVRAWASHEWMTGCEKTDQRKESKSKDLLETSFHQSLQEKMIDKTKYCFRKMYLAVVSKGGLKARQLGIKSQKRMVSARMRKGEFRIWGKERIKVIKQIRVTRNVMVPLRELDESGRFCVCVISDTFFSDINFNDSEHDRKTIHKFSLVPTAICLQPVSFIWPSRPSVTQPLLSLQTSLFLFIHCNRIVLSIHSWINRQSGWPTSLMFTKHFHVHDQAHFHSSSV